MRTLNIGVVMDRGADFNLVIGIRGKTGPIDLTGYAFLGNMSLSTDPSSPIAGGFKASGKITLTANPVDGDTLTVNGTVITFRALNPASNEVLIGTAPADTAVNLTSFLTASQDVNISKATYTLSGLVITVTYVTVGVVGNAFTLVAVSTAITLSGATLTGGIDAAQFIFTLLDQSTNMGQVKWSLPKAVVDTISASISNDLQTRRQKTPYVFDIKMKDTAGIVTRIIQGIAYLSPQVTQGVIP